MKAQDFSDGKRRLATFDVDKLYPSLDPKRVLTSVRLLATKFFAARQLQNWGVFVEVVVGLLAEVLKSQVVCFRRLNADGSVDILFFLQVSGITTGLSCACQVANLHLVAMDEFMQQSLRGQIYAYKRFIDDILIVYSDQVEVAVLVQLLNEFEPGIKVTHEVEHPLHVSFLDISIDIRDNQLKYTTYRKPMNTYAYTPADSCHPDAVFRGVIATELIRLRRTCSHAEDFNSQVLFFFQKLNLRGYSLETCFNVLHTQNPMHCKPSDKLLVPFKLPYSPSVHLLRTNQFWHKHSKILPESIRNGLRFVHCHLASPNLFRLRYFRFNEQS